MAKFKSLTTGQAAEHCHVSQATIVNWIKRGTLKAYTTPGGHHRILLTDFVAFLEAYGIPVDTTLRQSQARVLIVGGGPHAEMLARTVREGGCFDVALARNACEAGAEIVEFEPTAVVLDATDTTLDLPSVCQWLRASPKGKGRHILAVGDPADEEAAWADGVTAYVPTSEPASRLGAELETLLAARHE